MYGSPRSRCSWLSLNLLLPFLFTLSIMLALNRSCATPTVLWHPVKHRIAYDVGFFASSVSDPFSQDQISSLLGP